MSCPQDLRCPNIMIVVLQVIALLACAYILFLANSIPFIAALFIAVLFIAAAALGLRATNAGTNLSGYTILTGAASQVTTRNFCVGPTDRLPAEIKVYWIVLGVAVGIEVLAIIVVVALHFVGYPAWTTRTGDRAKAAAHFWYVTSGVISWGLMQIITFVCAGLGINNSLKLVQSYLKTESPQDFDLDEELTSSTEETISLDEADSVEDELKEDSKIGK